jgi:TPR repeat protein
VPRDAKVAADWLRRSARQGHAPAQYALGVAYYSGYGVPKDAEQALGWIAEAEKNGHPEAIEAMKQFREPRARLRD